MGSQGVPLTPMASLAVDPAFHAWGVPVFIDGEVSGQGRWNGLVIAQDAGGAITGPVRGDLFFGWGDEAGQTAGRQNSFARWHLLLPNALAARLRRTS
ncbi:3D domain-containing protein, partial [Glycocaulis sp.]|uniref:3D domain-containing protein n=1 Tax=Glycocaulis sp. TaxID=1969725 RepID=UPI003D1D448B